MAAATLALGAACGTTGGTLLDFVLEARGVSAAAAPFTTPAGYTVELSRARLLVGAVYFNQVRTTDWSLETGCILPGLYTGEVRGGLVVDALSTAPQAFPARGVGTDLPTSAAELWLTEGDVNADDSRAVVLEVAGTARADGGVWPFEGALTIGANRVVAPSNPALPGANPLCKQRIVSPITVDLRLRPGATVTLTVDARRYFEAVDFSALTPDEASPGRFRFRDEARGAVQPETALYTQLRAISGVYALGLSPPP